MSENVIDFGAAQIARRRKLVNAPLEQSLLGLLLQHSEYCDLLPLGFTSGVFAVQSHPDIFRAILAAHDRVAKGPVLLLVLDILKAVDRDADYITSLLTTVIGYTSDYLKSYASVLLGLSVKRAVVDILDEVRDRVFDDDGASSDEILSDIISRAQSVSHLSNARPMVTLDTAMDRTLNDSRMAGQRSGITGITTGMPAFDREFDGLQPADLIVLAGRPGMGKSALAMQWAISAARHCRDQPHLGGVFIGSLEMKAHQLARRALAECGNVPIRRIKTGRIEDDAYKLELARQELDNLPVLIEDTGGIDIEKIKLRARQAAHRFGRLSLIVLDHLHIIEPDERDIRKGETYAIGRISGACKIMAKLFDCPVLLLAQLNRKVEERDDKRPQLADLRQSGSIEQDADLVVFLYRDEYYIEPQAPARRQGEKDEAHKARTQQWTEHRANAAGKAEAIIAKNREGEKSTLNLSWHGETTSFGDPL